MLLNENATVTIAHSKTENIEKLIKKADIVCACCGKAKFVKPEWVKKAFLKTIDVSKIKNESDLKKQFKTYGEMK
jgi:methylenetetrahydrofolate dehydrogenase (NADP+)/methenyltetrahydrofolate cyclohydrolase